MREKKNKYRTQQKNRNWQILKRAFFESINIS